MPRSIVFAMAIAATATALPAAARDSDQPVATREPDAQDVAMTPLTDLNLAKDEIPAVLVAATSDPYASDGLTACPAIQAAIADLDAALGPDMDVVSGESDRLSTGRMAKSVVASFIPFRGILRELTGAAEQERDWRGAIYAGSVRRGFLKGLGQQKGCAYPARPAFTRVTILEAPTPSKRKGGKRVASKDAPTVATFVSEPVIQSIPSTKR
jgi:hypothetical protein